MHEAAAAQDLVRKALSVAEDSGADGVCAVRVRQGPLGHLSRSHLIEYFTRAAEGTPVAGADLVIEDGEEGAGLVLVSVTVT